MSRKIKDEIMKTYPAGHRYLAFPETKEVWNDFDTFARRGAFLGVWEMAKRFALSPIKTCITNDRKRKIKGIRQLR